MNMISFKKSDVVKTFILLTVACSVFYLFYSKKLDVGLYFISFFYCVANLFLSYLEKNNLNHSIAYRFFRGIIFLKYYFMPLALIVMGKNSLYSVFGPKPLDSSLVQACYIMIYELFVIVIIRAIYLYRYRRNNHSFKVSSFSIKNNLLFVVIVFIILLIAPNISIIPKLATIQQEVLDNLTPTSKLSIVNGIWKYLFFITFSTIILKGKISKSINVNLFLFLLLVIVTLILIASSSRWAILFLLLVSLYLLRLYFKSKANIPIVIISSLSIAFAISISLSKFSWGINESSYLQDLAQLSLSLMQSYMSGPSLIAQTIDMSSTNEIMSQLSYQTFINDFTGTIPLVSKLVDLTDRTNIYYNQYIFGLLTDNISQIVPLSGIGYIYFGFFLSPILVGIFMYVGYVFEGKVSNTSELYCKVLLLYGSFWCFLSICLNSQIVFGNIVIMPVIVYLLIKTLNHKISIK